MTDPDTATATATDGHFSIFVDSSNPRQPGGLMIKSYGSDLTVAASAGVGLAGCAGVDGERYDGVYDPNFYNEIETYAGEEVSLSAEVLDVFSPTSFTIISGDDPTADPLLVLNEGDTEPVVPGMPIQVTGVVLEAFDPEIAEEAAGIDLDDAFYEDWLGEFYLEVTAIDAPEASSA